MEWSWIYGRKACPSEHCVKFGRWRNKKRNGKKIAVLLVAPGKSFIIRCGSCGTCIDCILFANSLSLCVVRSRAMFISREKEIMFEWKMMQRNRKAIFGFKNTKKNENITLKKCTCCACTAQHLSRQWARSEAERDLKLREREKEEENEMFYFSFKTDHQSSHCCNSRNLACGVGRVWEYTITQPRSVQSAVLCSLHIHYCVRCVVHIFPLGTLVLSLYNNNRCHFIKIIIVGRCCSMCGII